PLARTSRRSPASARPRTRPAVAVGVRPPAIARGLRSFVPDPEQNPGRANLFAMDGRLVVVDYAHNEAGMRGLTEIARGLSRPGAETWLAIRSAGDPPNEILHGPGFPAALGAD